MATGKIVPENLGKFQCLNPNEQCYYGQGDVKALREDKSKQDRFTQECTKHNGKQIKCCHPDLINVTYNSHPYEIPLMVQNVSGNRFNSCPAEVQARCYNQPEKQIPLCIQNACLDNGYRLASNYYEICKAFKDNPLDDIPDCLTTSCWGDQIDMVFDYNDELPPAPKEEVPLPPVVPENSFIKYYNEINASYDIQLISLLVALVLSCICIVILILI